MSSGKKREKKRQIMPALGGGAAPTPPQMPKIDKEKRQRGKKHKKAKQEEPISEESLAGPSWIAPQPAVQELDQPFGALDPDLKAYLRSVDLKLNEWRDTEWDVQLTEDELQGEYQP
ncbi:hypothetical protein FRC00_000306 [Tulasnella sp. 408]|nr:hypothetical protein FRC00_000306 [Tulasnella sp. 408]